MKYLHLNLPSLATATALSLLLCSTIATADIKASYLYTLSDFNGAIPYSWTGLSSDREHSEVLVINDGIVSIFNNVGMEIYHFGDDSALGTIVDVAVEQDGKIMVLSHNGDSYSILRCNFRGELKEALELRGLPQEFSKILPRRLVSWKGYLYLADLYTRKIVVIDSTGSFVDGYDVGAYLAKEEKTGSENNIVGFSVDREGNMLFTVPTLFTAFRMSRDHQVQSFGSAGNVAGKFNIVADIASDDRGFIYVVDTLKSVVMVYDKEFKFQMQFGSRGEARDNLTAPQRLAVLNDKVFVNQARRRGVSVFRIAYD